MAAEKLTRYTASQKTKLLRQFNNMLDGIFPLLEEKYGIDDAVLFRKQTESEFRDLIVPIIPFIGGRSNPYTVYLNETAMALAVYRMVQQRGGKVEEAGELIFKGMLILVNQIPKPFARLYGRWINSRVHYPRMRKEAQASHDLQYPADWVYDFVDGDGKNFNYGIDMYECGIIKFLHSQGADELIPYLCSVDYVTNYALGIELQRTKTLADGCTHCNFRFIIKGNPSKPSWPPQFPEKENQ